MTNATKAQIIAVVNAMLGVASAFWFVNETQQAAVIGLVNAAMAAWVAFTYKKSSKRKDDGS